MNCGCFSVFELGIKCVLADYLDTMEHHLLRYSILFLEWSKGGILTPSSLVRGAKERSNEAFLERSKKRSLLLKNWRVPNPASIL